MFWKFHHGIPKKDHMNLITEGNMSPKSDSVPNVPTSIYTILREKLTFRKTFTSIFMMSPFCSERPIFNRINRHDTKIKI
jgi:hypothetical protein